MRLTRELIQDVRDLETIGVDVPEWGGFVTVSTLTGTARDHYESSIIKVVNGTAQTDMLNIRAKLVCACCVDEDGEQLFSDDDITWLGHKSSAALERIFAAAQKLNAVTDEDIEDLAKN